MIVTMAKLTINGQIKEFESQLPQTLSKLLENLGVNQATIVAEIDGKIIDRNSFGSTVIKEGQVIELIKFVGGG
jgi:sulfur carrier protein